MKEQQVFLNWYYFCRINTDRAYHISFSHTRFSLIAHLCIWRFFQQLFYEQFNLLEHILQLKDPLLYKVLNLYVLAYPQIKMDFLCINPNSRNVLIFRPFYFEFQFWATCIPPEVRVPQIEILWTKSSIRPLSVKCVHWNFVALLLIF